MKLIEPSYIRELEDIRLNEEHWIQKINLIEFNDKNIEGTPQKGKVCWTRNYETIPHWERYNIIKKWFKNTQFLEYSCKIVKNEVGEIELYTKNAFGPPAEIYWEGKDLIRKIIKKIGEEVRRKDEELLPYLNHGGDAEHETPSGTIEAELGAEVELDPQEIIKYIDEKIKGVEADLKDEKNDLKHEKNDEEKLKIKANIKTLEELKSSLEFKRKVAEQKKKEAEKLPSNLLQYLNKKLIKVNSDLEYEKLNLENEDDPQKKEETKIDISALESLKGSLESLIRKEGGQKAKYTENPEKEEKPELTKEQEKILKDYRKELKKLGQSIKYEDFINSPHSYLYSDLKQKLMELRSRKNLLGKNQVQITYDLNRPDLAILWRKQLYFIIDFQYVNNYKAYVWIRARKCKLALYYWNWQKGGGRAVLEYAPNNLIEEVSEYDADGVPKNLMQSSRMHYEFCGELGVKRIYQSEFDSYQPKFSLFYADHAGKRDPSYAEKKERSETTEGKPLLIPSDIHLKQLPDMKEAINKALGGDKIDMLGDLFDLPFTMTSIVFKELINIIPNLAGGILKAGAKIATLGLVEIDTPKLKVFDTKKESEKLRKLLNDLMGGKVFLTIGPREHDKGNSFFSHMEKKKEVLFKDTPQPRGGGKAYVGVNEAKVAKKYKEWFREQPHLWDHTTIQFYLFNNITMMGNGQFLGIQYDKELDNFVLPYNLYVNHAPSVLVYRWEFKYITVKCEIKCAGTFQDNFNIMRVITSISVFGCGIGLNAMGVNVNSLKDANDLKPATNPDQEQQGERTFKSTLFDTLNKSIEPSMMAGNTIDFHYSLNEFFCRLTDPLWFYRIETSELLYNNLKWCNNKTKILYLPLEWENLARWTQGTRERGSDKRDTRRLGFWRWKGVKLDNDIDGFFTDIMTRGYLLDGGLERKNPVLKYERQEGYVKEGGNEWDTYECEEEIKETTIETPGEDQQLYQADPDPNNQVTKGGAFDTFIEFEDTGAFNQFRQNLQGPAVNQLWNTVEGTRISWGRFLTGGADGGSSQWYWNSGWAGIGSEWVADMNTGEGTTITMKLNNNGGETTELLRGGDYKIHIKFPSLENIQVWITGGVSKTTIRESVFTEKKTTTQEIDEEKLEQEGEYEEEICGEDELNENEIEEEDEQEGEGQSSERDLEREREREKEQEKEEEKEGEKEQEGEKEDETEKEDEKEKEKEKEREKEKEKEKEREKERESEEESESESEQESEGEEENEA